MQGQLPAFHPQSRHVGRNAKCTTSASAAGFPARHGTHRLLPPSTAAATASTAHCRSKCRAVSWSNALLLVPRLLPATAAPSAARCLLLLQSCCQQLGLWQLPWPVTSCIAPTTQQWDRCCQQQQQQQKQLGCQHWDWRQQQAGEVCQGWQQRLTPGVLHGVLTAAEAGTVAAGLAAGNHPYCCCPGHLGTPTDLPALRAA